MLFLLVAASIATAAVVGVAGSVRARALEDRRDTLIAQVAETRAQLGELLVTDPDWFLSSVWALEPTRLCPLAGGDTEHPAGSPWPGDSCGSGWAYKPGSAPSDLAVTVTAPSVTNPHLVANIVAVDGPLRYGEQIIYTKGRAGRWTVWDHSSINLDDLPAGGSVAGAAYTSGQFVIPSAGRLTGTGTVVAADETVAGGTPQTDVLWYQTGGPNPANPHARPLDELTAAPAGPGWAAEVADDLTGVACPTAGTTATLLAGNRSSHLCLRPGFTIFDDTGTPKTLDPLTAAVMLVFDPTAAYGPAGAGKVAIWARTDELLTDVDNAGLALNDPTGAARTAGDSAVSSSNWTLVGLFNPPPSGLVASSAQVVVGACGEGWSATGTCLNRSSTLMTATSSWTVVAGTASAPTELFIGGPVLAADGAHLALVAAGNLVVPYWATTRDAALPVEAQLLAGGTLRTDPLTSSAHPADTTPALTVAGSAMGSDITWTFPIFADVDITRRDTPSDHAPWLAGPERNWRPLSARPLTPAELVTIP